MVGPVEKILVELCEDQILLIHFLHGILVNISGADEGHQTLGVGDCRGECRFVSAAIFGDHAKVQKALHRGVGGGIVLEKAAFWWEPGRCISFRVVYNDVEIQLLSGEKEEHPGR